MQGACFPTHQRPKDAGRRCVKLERALQLAFTLMFNLSITIALALIPTLTWVSVRSPLRKAHMAWYMAITGGGGAAG